MNAWELRQWWESQWTLEMMAAVVVVFFGALWLYTYAEEHGWI